MSCCGTKSVMFLTCSGGCNVGQIANDAARQLDSLGLGKMYCAVGVALQLEGFPETARAAQVRVALDGCERRCVVRALEALEIPVEASVVVTDLGIEKAHRFDYSQDEVARVGDAAMKAVAALSRS